MTTEVMVCSDNESGPPDGRARHCKAAPATLSGAAATSLADSTVAKGCPDGPFGGRRLLGDLLVAAGRHDEAAFARFYELTSPWVFYLMRRQTTSTAHADDATCLVYTTVWRRAASFAPSVQSALAWVTSIAYEVVGS